MFLVLLFFHSIVRWLLLTSLGCSLFISGRKYLKKLPFTKSDDSLRHWTATIAHLQLMIGMVMYFKTGIDETFFFKFIHISLMIIAIIMITIGSALSKRQEEEQAKFRLLLIFYGIALFIIFCAIPWPFSPLAQRPLFRNF